MGLNELTRTKVNAELARRGVSQRELARRLGWSQQFMWRRLAGRMPFTTSELEQIAAALDVPVSQLLPTEPAR